MMVKVTMTGLTRFAGKLDKVEKAAKEAQFNALAATAFAIQRDAVQSIQRGPKSGETYTHGRKTHTASAPGEAPASDTGNLAKSIRVKLEKARGYAEVIAHAPYAPHLEFGTSRMAARPFMGPAFHRNRKLAPQLIKVDFKQAIRKG